MGKKTRREREEKRESFATQRSREKNKNTLIAVGIAAIVVVIVGYSAYIFVTTGVDTPGAPQGAGPLGSAHEHTSILVRVFGDKFDFSSSAYQIKSQWIHFEGQDGDTIHRHATGVTLGYMFDTLSFGLDDQCFIFPNERPFCTDENYSLKFFINHKPESDIRDYIGQEGDRVLISYGNEDAIQIDEQLIELDSMR